MSVPSTISNLEYGSLLSTTLMNYRNTFYDNIFNAIPIFVMLRNRKRTEEGGERIVIPLAYSQNSTFKSMSGYETVDTTPQDNLTSAFSQWKEMAGSISISQREENQNRGKYQVINLLTAKTKIAEMSAAEELALQSTGVIATTDPSKDLTPLGHLIQKDPSGTSTVENIAQGTYSWWRNQQYNSAASAWATFLTEMESLYNSCSKGGGKGQRSAPNWILCNKGYYELYLAAARDKSRIIKYDDTIANMGFGGAKFHNAVLTWDEYLPDFDGTTNMTKDTLDSYTFSYYNALFLNTEFLEYVVISGSDLDVGPFIQPENQKARTAIIYNMANLVTSNRRKQGLHHGVSTSITS